MEQTEHYLKLNSNLVEIPNLSPRAKLLYGYIVSLSQQNGYCFATNAFFMKKLSVCERTVTRTIAELKKFNLKLANGDSPKTVDADDLFF